MNYYGNGRCITVPFQIGTFYYKEGHSNSLRFLQDILFNIAKMDEIVPELSPMVEITWKRSGDKYVLQFVNNSGLFSNSCFAPIRICNIQARLPHMAGRSAKALNGGILSVANDGDALVVQLNELNEYEAIVLK